MPLLADKVCIITGLGLASAKLFLSEDAKVSRNRYFMLLRTVSTDARTIASGGLVRAME